MAEKSGKHDLCAGTSWSLFGENVLFEDSEDVDTSDNNDAETTRLHKEDMHQFGLCPARDALNLLVCKECQKVLFPVSLKRHYERRHPKLIPRVKSPPRRTLPPPKEITPVKQPPSYGKSKILKSPDNSFIRIEEVDPNDISVKIEEVPLTIPKFNHTAKAKLPKINLKGLTGVSGKAKVSPVSTKPLTAILNPVKKGTGNKDKEYDPDRHCGVWMAEQTRNCTRSLTCKTHSLSLRRAVSGRSKSFDVLLAEHKAKVNSIKEAGVSPGGATPTPSPTKSASCGPPFPLGKLDGLGKVPSSQNTQVLRSPKATGPLVSSTLESRYSAGISGHHTENGNSVDFLSDESIGSSNLPTIPYHPRPLKVNTFGSCMPKRGGCVVFNRRMSHFRCATKSMLERFSNPLLRSSTSKTQSASEGMKMPSASRSDGMCTIQVVDQGRQSVSNFKSSGMNLPSFSDPSQLGPVPRVKTKKLHAGMKRQMSADVQPAETPTLQTPNKRRHSIDANPSVLSAVSSNVTETNGQNGIKHLKELGHVVANIDSVSSYEIKAVGSTTASSTVQGKNTLTSNASGPSVNLNSSLSLCQSMGVGIQGETGHGATPTFNVQGGHSSLANTTSQVGSTICTIGGVLGRYGTGNVASGSLSSSQSPTSSTSMAYCVAPNVSVTQGMMVSLPNIQSSQTPVLYQSSLSVSGKDGLAFAGSLRSQLPPSTGILIRSQSVSPLPNGTGPSPPPVSKTYVTQYGANVIATCGSYVVGTTKLKPSPSSSPNTVNFTSRQQVGGTAPRVSQLLVQQPNLARVQATGKVGSSSHIISSTSTAGLGTNAPITQFKQMQMQLGQSNAAQRSRTQSNNHGPSNVNLSSETRQDILNAGNSSQLSLASRTFQHQGSFLEPLAPTPSEGDAASIL